MKLQLKSMKLQELVMDFPLNHGPLSLSLSEFRAQVHQLSLQRSEREWEGEPEADTSGQTKHTHSFKKKNQKQSQQITSIRTAPCHGKPAWWGKQNSRRVSVLDYLLIQTYTCDCIPTMLQYYSCFKTSDFDHLDLLGWLCLDECWNERTEKKDKKESRHAETNERHRRAGKVKKGGRSPDDVGIWWLLISTDFQSIMKGSVRNSRESLRSAVMSLQETCFQPDLQVALSCHKKRSHSNQVFSLNFTLISLNWQLAIWATDCFQVHHTGLDQRCTNHTFFSPDTDPVPGLWVWSIFIFLQLYTSNPVRMWYDNYHCFMAWLRLKPL